MGSAKTRKGGRERKLSGIRLDAYLARAGLASRREARGLIRQGLVQVAGEVCRDASRRIAGEAVWLREERVNSPAELRDFVLHKPLGLSCSHDERESPLVFDLLSETLRRRGLRIAGRLDRATSGLLILTTDGDLVHRLTHPTRKLPKRYQIEFEGALASDSVERCAAGFLLSGEEMSGDEMPGDERPTRPAELRIERPGHATLVLREGRTHQVRRMIRRLGGEVVGLQRDRIGDLELPPDLAPGDLRPLAPEERTLLLSASNL